MRKILALLSLLAFSVAAAEAATLSGIQGQVLVNKGSGFVRAKPGDTIAPGDRVMVQQGGSAQVSFPNGAVANVQPGTVFTVPTVPPVAGLPGLAGAAAGGIPQAALIAGGVAAAAGAGALIYQASKPSSN